MPPECHHISNAGFKDERGRTDHVKAMEQVIKDDGGEVLYSHDLVKLVQDKSGAVTGAIFKVEGGSLLTTIDGVRINKHCQAVDKNYQPIPGLYVVGTASGSYYAGNYPVYLVGNCLGRQVTFGRYAARHAAGDIA
ncbi:MAG: FAD-binding protein [Eggerthellales bacterium]|nr:FAD-binding protein [Eggerthellales bacterium]